jgi:macrodomain Ter protein organizer (MatP/YcbG family)
MKKKTSIAIDENVWEDVKIFCIKNKMDISDFLEKTIKEKLKKSK